MRTMDFINRYVVERAGNVVRVDFTRKPDPPAPRFPGANAQRWHNERTERVNAAIPAPPSDTDAVLIGNTADGMSTPLRRSRFSTALERSARTIRGQHGSRNRGVATTKRFSKVGRNFSFENAFRGQPWSDPTSPRDGCPRAF
jgi:hypothetical protein